MAVKHDRYRLLQQFYALIESDSISDAEAYAATLTMACDLGSTLVSREEFLRRAEQLFDAICETEKPTPVAPLRLVSKTG